MIPPSHTERPPCGGTMHCSHSSGNKINTSSPRDPTMGLFHGGTRDRPTASTWRGAARPAQSVPTLSWDSGVHLAWPGLAMPAHFLAVAEYGQCPEGGDWAEPVRVGGERRRQRGTGFTGFLLWVPEDKARPQSSMSTMCQAEAQMRTSFSRTETTRQEAPWGSGLGAIQRGTRDSRSTPQSSRPNGTGRGAAQSSLTPPPDPPESSHALRPFKKLAFAPPPWLSG